jgi:NSS family neurotransmitter:Na+ symporter
LEVPLYDGGQRRRCIFIIYLLSTLLVGLPVMISETMLGRKARADAITTLRKVAPSSFWWLIGASGVLAAF